MLSKNVLRRIGLKKYLKNNVIETLDATTKICIDVGLSETAPYSGMWLSNDSDRCVLGIEALQWNWERLGGPEYDKSASLRWPIVRLDTNSIIFEDTKLIDISNRFFGLSCAIDDIPRPKKREFYHMHEAGSSSLLKPSEKHTSSIKEVETVQCVSLQDILEYVDWNKFKFIEHIKIDCEGHDAAVIRSLGKYLKKTIFLTFEMSAANQGHWEQQVDPTETMHFLRNNNFHCFRYDGSNSLWVNGACKPALKWIGWIEGKGRQTALVVDPQTSLVYYCDMIRERTSEESAEELMIRALQRRGRIGPEVK